MNPICTLFWHQPFPICNVSILLVCGSGEDSNPVERERCSRVHLDAITSDNAGNTYAFRGAIWMQPNASSETVPILIPAFPTLPISGLQSIGRGSSSIRTLLLNWNVCFRLCCH